MKESDAIQILVHSTTEGYDDTHGHYYEVVISIVSDKLFDGTIWIND